MTRTLTIDEIFDLPVSERLHLIETLWDSINPNDLPVPESHQRALDIALADYKQSGGRTFLGRSVVSRAMSFRVTIRSLGSR
jgi:putative addiction module component (TIGR02574 family)